MKKSILLATFFILSFSFSFAQLNPIKGSVADTTQDKFIKNAVIVLLTPKDSIFYAFTRTDANGNFTLKNIAPGKYILMTTHPYFGDVVENIEMGNAEKNLKKIVLTSKSKLLQEVIVKSGMPIKIKGDTTIYTADSFKVSANANVEELLKKLPGIQVDRDGKIKAMGETVEKVLVDGEEFFGDDPGMAVKNLRADAVKEVQVFDKKSDQAEFTGIDDGNSKKTINLKLKEDKKKGYFGKLDAAGGLQDKIDDRYNTNAMINAFKGKRKLSAFLLSGNTGQDGLSWQDNDKYGGNDDMSMEMTDDGGMMMWRGGGSDDEPYVDTDNGFIRNVNAGLQYSNKWNDKQTVNFSPKYNSQIYTNGVSEFTQAQIGDSIFNTNSSKNIDVNRYNIKTSASYDVKLDSNNSLKITASANFYNSTSEETNFSGTTGNTKTPKNSSSTINRINSDKQSFSSSIIFKHKFKKLRRTLSFNADFNALQSEADNYLNATNQAFNNGIPVSPELLDQLRDNERSSTKITGRLVYTEPLGKKYSLEIGHELSFTKGLNTQVTYDYNTLNDKYDTRVDTLSNEFAQTIIVNKPTVKFSYNSKKLKAVIGSGFGITNFDFTDQTVNKEYNRNFTNIFPQANFTYTYKSNHSLRLNYNGNTRQPTLNQVQPLRNITNRFNQYIGNPNLKQSFSNNFNLSHNAYNFIKDIWGYQSLNFSTTSNAITNNVVTNINTGERITQPINTNGNMNVSFWSGMGFKLKKADVRVNLQPNFNFSKNSGFINDQKNISKTLSTGFGFNLSKSKDKKYDFSIGNNISFNRNTTTQNDLINKFSSNNFDINATVYYKKTWSIISDFSYYTRPKTAQIPTAINNKLWNARLQKTFKKDEFTAYVMVRDILNQNIGVDRNFYENTFSETRNERLQRYWMVGFTWNFKNKTTTK
jgi:Outer membrane protein beta-barrel family/Carboxypeptidase regulatory-like domain